MKLSAALIMKGAVAVVAAAAITVTGVFAAKNISRNVSAKTNPIRTIVSAAEQTSDSDSCSFTFGSQIGLDSLNVSGKVELREKDNYFALEVTDTSNVTRYVAFEKGYLKFYEPDNAGGYVMRKAEPRQSALAALAIELVKSGFSPEEMLDFLKSNSLTSGWVSELSDSDSSSGTSGKSEAPKSEDLEKALKSMENTLSEHEVLRDVLGYENITVEGRTTYAFSPDLRALEDTIQESFVGSLKDKAYYQQLNDLSAVLRAKVESYAPWLFEKPVSVSFDVTKKGYLVGASFDYEGSNPSEVIKLYFSFDDIGSTEVELLQNARSAS